MLYGTQTLMECNRKAVQEPQYAATMRNRPARKHRVFEIGNGVFFEFWSPREWEFTVLPLEIDHDTGTSVCRSIRGRISRL